MPLVAVALLSYGIGLVQPILLRGPLVVGQDAVTGAASASVRVTVEDVNGRVLHIVPSEASRVVLIIYPGGLVRPQAYEWLGRALASDGVETWIPEMPVDLAVLAKDRADTLIAASVDRPVVLAGHSLGGAMAADYAARQPGRLRGLVLMGAYPAADVRVRAPWSALTLAAEHDGLATPDKVRDGLSRLPEGSRLSVVPGAVHAFFGRYGPQSGDGVPTVSRADAEASIVAVVRDYLAPIR